MITVKVKKPKPTNETTCESCGAVLNYEPSDKHIGYMGYDVITCPECGEETPVSEGRVHGCIFPNTFIHSSSSLETKKCTNEEVQQFIDNIRQQMKSLNAGEFTLIGTGDTYVIGLKYADEEDIVVCKDYWEDCFFNDKHF